MRNLRNKTKDQGGFTLIEMLVVVAIIAILVAVSIPMISSALEKARNATDAANERAAKAEAAIAYLTETLPTQLDNNGKSTGKPITQPEICFYDAANGKLAKNEVGAITSIVPYGKCTNDEFGSHKDCIIRVEVSNTTGEIKLMWVKIGAVNVQVGSKLHNSVVTD